MSSLRERANKRIRNFFRSSLSLAGQLVRRWLDRANLPARVVPIFFHYSFAEGSRAAACLNKHRTIDVSLSSPWAQQAPFVTLSAAVFGAPRMCEARIRVCVCVCVTVFHVAETPHPQLLWLLFSLLAKVVNFSRYCAKLHRPRYINKGNSRLSPAIP